jgi:8-oxo-dGTP pyrophosphatase MutT (NUDIX family)
VIEAAGGVVLRDGPAGPEVLVVHRVRYDDWSLPKGKLDPGETAEQGAVREVEEETGVRAAIGPELPTMRYEVAGEPKRVRWFRMTAVAGDPRERPADREVDAARWWPVAEALVRLSYPHDRRLLAEVVGGTAV